MRETLDFLISFSSCPWQCPQATANSLESGTHSQVLPETDLSLLPHPHLFLEEEVGLVKDKGLSCCSGLNTLLST